MNFNSSARSADEDMFRGFQRFLGRGLWLAVAGKMEDRIKGGSRFSTSGTERLMVASGQIKAPEVYILGEKLGGSFWDTCQQDAQVEMESGQNTTVGEELKEEVWTKDTTL